MRRAVTFVAHSFAAADSGLVMVFKQALRRRGCTIVSGERSEARRISDKIKKRINASDLFLAILTRRHRTREGWTTSPWVVEEKGYSLGQNPNRPIILLVEDGIPVPDETGGLGGDVEYIRFDRDRLDLAKNRLGEVIFSFFSATR